LLFTGIRGYVITVDSALSVSDSKYHAENLLYVALIASILVMLSYGTLMVRSRSLIKEIDKIIELSRVGSTTVEESLKKIGLIGRKILRIYDNLNDLNTKKTLKISSLAGINTFLLNNIDLSLLITDASGRVIDASLRYRRRDRSEKGEVSGKHIGEVFQDLDFEDIAESLATQRNLVERRNREVLNFCPVFNRDGELSHVICVIGKEEINTETTSPTKQTGVKKRRLIGFIKSFAQRRKISS
jgi:transcriptional regulator with PAS, ATPase and Fis domain